MRDIFLGILYGYDVVIKDVEDAYYKDVKKNAIAHYNEMNKAWLEKRTKDYEKDYLFDEHKKTKDNLI